MALAVGASSVLRLNGRMAAGEKNTNFMASVSAGLINGGRCRTPGCRQHKISLYNDLGKEFNNYLYLALNFEESETFASTNSNGC